MKVKFNKDEMKALEMLLQSTIVDYNNLKSNNLLGVESLLQKAMIEELWVAVAKKNFEIKKAYSFDLKPRWAIAVFIEYNGRFQPKGKVNAASFTGNMIIQLCNSIHKNYIV